VLDVARVCCPGRIVSVCEGGYGSWKWVAQPPPPTAEGEDAAATAGAAAASSSTLSSAGSDAGAAVDAPPPPVPLPPAAVVKRPVLCRDTLAECAAAHLRALIDDGGGVSSAVEQAATDE
jgi:hypothetical protein